MTSSLSSKKAAVPKLTPFSDPSSEGPLFALSQQSSAENANQLKNSNKLENWKENPFFKQIAKDRQEFNFNMGRKYNLNFECPDSLFDTKDSSPEIQSGKRQNIIWERINTNTDTVRWNSYETRTMDQNQNSIQINSNEIRNQIQNTRLTSTNIRTIEQNLVSSGVFENEKCGKSSMGQNHYGQQINRFTQATRDTGMSSGIDGQMTDRTQQEDPFAHRLSNSLFSESIIDSAREMTDGKQSDLSKIKGNFNPENVSDNLFDSQKDTASQSHNNQQEHPKMMPAAPPKLRKNKKKLVASTRLGGSNKAPVMDQQPQPLFQLTKLTQVSLNYGNKQMNANQSAIQEALKKNLEDKKHENSKQTNQESTSSHLKQNQKQSFIRQVKSMDRQESSHLSKVEENQEPQNSSAPIDNKWLTPQIMITSVGKNVDQSSKSNVELSTNQMIGKRINCGSIMVSSNESQQQQLLQAKMITKKYVKPLSRQSDEKSTEKIRANSKQAQVSPLPNSNKQPSPNNGEQVANRHAQVGLKPQGYTSFLSNFTKRDREKNPGQITSPNNSSAKANNQMRKSMEKLNLGAKNEDQIGTQKNSLTASFIYERDTPQKSYKQGGLHNSFKINQSSSPKTKLAINLNNLAAGKTTRTTSFVNRKISDEQKELKK